MFLAQHLDKLCQEILMLLPPPNRDGSYTLHFDLNYRVRFFIDRGRVVLVSDGFGDSMDPTKNAAYWECIEKALQRSYAWHGLCTTLAFDDSERLTVQSVLSEASPYEQFFNITNAHCSFCELLLTQMQQPLNTRLDTYAYLTP